MSQFKCFALVALVLVSPSWAGDTWVFLGDSLTVGMIGSGDGFAQGVKEAYGADVRAVNTSRVGKHVTEYVSEIDGILARNPDAKYFPFLIGANDVLNYSAAQAAWVRGKLVTVLDKIVAAGRTPILLRLSYRNYQGGDPLEPFNVNVYDPLIRQYSPRWFDQASGRGLIDLHGFLKGHPSYLAGDGIHYTSEGYRQARQQLLVGLMAGVVYGAGGGSGASPSPTDQIGLLGVDPAATGTPATAAATASAAPATAAGDRAVRASLLQACRSTTRLQRALWLQQARARLEELSGNGARRLPRCREVAVYQSLLASLGAAPGPVDGIYGPLTRAGGRRVELALAARQAAQSAQIAQG